MLGDSDAGTFAAQTRRYGDLGITDFKLRIRGDPVRDGERGAVITGPVPAARIRFDADNLWRTPAQVIDHLTALGFVPAAIEEPLAAMDYAGLRVIARETGVSVILDESFLNEGHFAAARSLEGMAVVNLRVSKMGGLLRSLAVAAAAAEFGMPLIVGAQVGETSILTRAALLRANAFGGNLVAQEGAFGTLLLGSDMVARPLMFGRKDVLDADLALDRNLAGFGLDHLPDILPGSEMA